MYALDVALCYVRTVMVEGHLRKSLVEVGHRSLMICQAQFPFS